DLNLSHLPPYLLETAETINNKNEYLLEPMVENIKNNDKQSQLNKEKDNLKIKRHRLEYQTIIQVLDKTGYTLDGKKKAAKM
ncbi:hypothetical protein ACQP3L_38590, partial [Escherichia coli]